jgi:hypothetical protein
LYGTKKTTKTGRGGLKNRVWLVDKARRAAIAALGRALEVLLDVLAVGAVVGGTDSPLDLFSALAADGVLDEAEELGLERLKGLTAFIR